MRMIAIYYNVLIIDAKRNLLGRGDVLGHPMQCIGNDNCLSPRCPWCANVLGQAIRCFYAANVAPTLGNGDGCVDFGRGAHSSFASLVTSGAGHRRPKAKVALPFVSFYDVCSFVGMDGDPWDYGRGHVVVCGASQKS